MTGAPILAAANNAGTSSDLGVQDAELPAPAPDESASPHSKPCSLCSRRRDVLIRCQTDSSRTWHFVCPGKCWREVSGGAVDGDGQHAWYRYGGTWKNKHELVSGKIKGRAKKENEGVEGSRRKGDGKKGGKRRGAGKAEVVGLDDGDGEAEMEDWSEVEDDAGGGALELEHGAQLEQ